LALFRVCLTARTPCRPWLRPYRTDPRCRRATVCSDFAFRLPGYWLPATAVRTEPSSQIAAVTVVSTRIGFVPRLFDGASFLPPQAAAATAECPHFTKQSQSYSFVNQADGLVSTGHGLSFTAYGPRSSGLPFTGYGLRIFTCQTARTNSPPADLPAGIRSVVFFSYPEPRSQFPVPGASHGLLFTIVLYSQNQPCQKKSLNQGAFYPPVGRNTLSSRGLAEEGNTSGFRTISRNTHGGTVFASEGWQASMISPIALWCPPVVSMAVHSYGVPTAPSRCDGHRERAACPQWP